MATCEYTAVGYGVRSSGGCMHHFLLFLERNSSLSTSKEPQKIVGASSPLPYVAHASSEIVPKNFFVLCVSLLFGRKPALNFVPGDVLYCAPYGILQILYWLVSALACTRPGTWMGPEVWTCDKNNSRENCAPPACSPALRTGASRAPRASLG